MAEEAPVNADDMKAVGRSAFVLGYTGEVGKALVEELNRQKIYKRVVLIGRRTVPLSVGPEFVSDELKNCNAFVYIYNILAAMAM